MAKKPYLRDQEFSTLAQAELLCRKGKDRNIGGKADDILKKYNELIKQEKSEARQISISSVEHNLAKWRMEKKIPYAETYLPWSQRSHPEYDISSATANFSIEEQPSGSKSPWILDKPWSMSTIVDHPIHPEALPTVLRVWKWCVAFGPGRPFTIRHAIWVARLYTTILDILDLYNWASIYADSERTTEILGKPFDSSNIDPALAMNPWEWATALFVRELTEPLYEKSSYGKGMLSLWVKCGENKRNDYIHIDTLYSPAPVKDGEWPGPNIIEIAEDEAFDSIKCRTAEHIKDGKTVMEQDLKTEKLIDEHQHQAKLNPDKWERELGDGSPPKPLSEESKWVYVYWLLCLTRGPKWYSLTVIECLDIIKLLRNWIRHHKWAIFGPIIREKEEINSDPDFKPTDLLRKVGYEI